jgi:ribosome-associated protein
MVRDRTTRGSDAPLDEDDAELGPSRSADKRAAEALQALGEELTRLKPELLATFELPDRLRDAIAQAQSITAHGALRRQRQFIGRLMRELDAAPIRARLLELRGEDAASRARFHRLERWRDRLIDEGDAALNALLEERPDADRTHLRQLAREARQERQQAADRPVPPMAQRALFRALRALFESDPAGG